MHRETESARIKNMYFGDNPTLDWQMKNWSTVDVVVFRVDNRTNKEWRDHFRRNIDERIRPFFSTGKFERTDYPIPYVSKDRLLNFKSFTVVPGMRNSHFQLHNNFLAVSSQDFIYPVKSSEGNIDLVHFNTQTQEKKILLTKHVITCMDVYGNYLLVGHDGGEISLIDLEASELKGSYKLQDNHHELINCLKFLPDRSGGLKAIIGMNKLTVEVWDLENSRTMTSNIAVDYFVNDLAVNKDMTSVALGYDALQVDVFDIRSSRRSSSLLGHEDYTFSVDFHDNQWQLASGNQDCSTRIWDLRANKEMACLPTCHNASYLVRYAKNSSYLLVGEGKSYVSAFDTRLDYTMKSSVDYFGELVGLDVSKDSGEVYIGIGEMYAEVNPGILRLALGPQMQPILPDELEEY